MKKITILFIAAVMSMAVGCSSDDAERRVADEIFEQSMMFGKWKLQSWKVGDQNQEINDCLGQYDFWQFFDTDDVNESFGEVISGECTQQLYSHKYTMSFTDFSVREINVAVPYQAKFKVTDISEDTFTIKLYWTSQETSTGGVDEHSIPEAEQPSYTYIKQ